MALWSHAQSTCDCAQNSHVHYVCMYVHTTYSYQHVLTSRMLDLVGKREQANVGIYIVVNVLLYCFLYLLANLSVNVALD